MKLLSKLIEKQIADYQQDLVNTHYQEVNTMYQQMRGWRHDYRNHLQTMKAHAANQDWQALCDYLNLLDEDLGKVDYVVKTGNAMCDAIINSKVSLAKSKDIPVHIDANVALKLNSNPIDLCCILGNLFDNAIDASMQLPPQDRLIRIYITMKNTQLYISFTNLTATKKQTKLNGLFKTSKGDSHGYGLSRIKSIVEKMDGYMNINSEDGAFSAEILLPQT